MKLNRHNVHVQCTLCIYLKLSSTEQNKHSRPLSAFGIGTMPQAARLLPLAVTNTVSVRRRLRRVPAGLPGVVQRSGRSARAPSAAHGPQVCDAVPYHKHTLKLMVDLQLYSQYPALLIPSNIQ